MRCLTRIKRQAPFQLNMQPLTMRRLLGVILIFIAGGYWYTRLAEVDIEGLNLPEQIHLPVFWIAYAAIAAWCMLPQLIKTPGAAEVNLLPNAPTPFSNQLLPNSDPFQMNGAWYVQWEGALWVWDAATSQWSHAQPPSAGLSVPPQY